MTVANINTRTTYIGNGATVNFPIDFALFEKDVVRVILIDELTPDDTTISGFDETLLVETTHYTFDAATPPTQVQMIIAPTSDEQLRVERLSLHTQPSNLIPGQDNADAIEIQLDRLTMQVQEHDTDISDNRDMITPTSPTATAGGFPDWVTATNYLYTQVVIQGGKQYRVTVDHTSNVFSTDLLDGKLEELNYTGIKGDQGDAGADGADGADSTVAGPPGASGGDGADGIFSEIASQVEAENGVNNTKGMTSLRTKQAIDSQVNPAQITTNQTNITNLTATVGLLTSRVIVLENQVQQATGKFSGQQILENNAGPIELLGVNASADPLNCGSALERSGVGTEFAKVLVMIRRKTDTEDRVASFDLVMQYVDGTWLIGREDTTQLDETLDLDGVVLSVNTVAQVGTVSYTTDLMAGANHDTQSLISWLGQEISRC